MTSNCSGVVNSFERVFTLAEGDTVLIMERSLDLPIQRVSPSDYLDFAGYLTDMQAVSRIRFRTVPVAVP